jgi:transposase
MTNDERLSLAEALEKYKYQPLVEKRHEPLKSGFDVRPLWLKSVSRVESLLWLYSVVELVSALLEREVRRGLRTVGESGLALYPEAREASAPTSTLIIGVLEGHRRHRLLGERGEEIRRFHDPLSEASQTVLTLLSVAPTAYGLA